MCILLINWAMPKSTVLPWIVAGTIINFEGNFARKYFNYRAIIRGGYYSRKYGIWEFGSQKKGAVELKQVAILRALIWSNFRGVKPMARGPLVARIWSLRLARQVIKP